jgi:glycerate 2-kinase
VVNPDDRRRAAIDIFKAGIAAATVGPTPALVRYDAETKELVAGDRRIDAAGLGRIVVIGAGKSAWPIVGSLFQTLREGGPPVDALDALVLAPGTAERARPAETWESADARLPRQASWQVLHVRPLHVNEPTTAAVIATRRVLELVRTLGPDDLLLCAFTGGGSAILCAPDGDLALEDKLEAVRDLTADGATIEEINTLRRHLSAVKGGRLAQSASGARAIVSFLVSDVDGDDPSVIASGPTSPDPTTYRNALDLREEWPPSVLRHLERGAAGALAETPRSLPENVFTRIIRTPSDAVAGASSHAQRTGWRVTALPRPTPTTIAGCVEAHMHEIRRAPDGTAILSVGEAPLELPWPPPRGGRAGHLALAIALAVDADPLLRDRVTVLVGATDGEDGTSGTAGGLLDGPLLREAEAAGADPARLLDRCESLRVLEAAQSALNNGNSGPNVQDLRVILVSSSA